MRAIPARIDVAVIGGGTAGTVAALQAARAGAKTVLIEIGSQLGGTMTTAGVTFPGLFHAWGKQVIAGIGWELVQKSVALDGSTMPDFTIPQPDAHWLHHVYINGALYTVLAEEAILQAGVTLRYYTMPVSVNKIPDGWRLSLVGKGEKYILECTQLVDCTGNAAVVDMAGFQRLRDKMTQPGTLMFRLSGYDARKLNEDVVQTAYEHALAEGHLQSGDFQHRDLPFLHFLQNQGWNAQHIPQADNSTASAHTAANVAGRQSLLRLLRFIRSLPGCENTRIDEMASETGVRETYRIQGEHIITVGEYTSGTNYTDAVCYTYYPIDLHDADGITPQPLKENIVPVIPLRALIPQNSHNLIVAGRCISSDRFANSALRVQASCMAMGQVAGGAAALAAASGISPGNVDLSTLKACLREHHAIVP